jgi:hypothetical protein
LDIKVNGMEVVKFAVVLVLHSKSLILPYKCQLLTEIVLLAILIYFIAIPLSLILSQTHANPASRKPPLELVHLPFRRSSRALGFRLRCTGYWEWEALHYAACYIGSFRAVVYVRCFSAATSYVFQNPKIEIAEVGQFGVVDGVGESAVYYRLQRFESC